MSSISTGNNINKQNSIKQVNESIELIKLATKNPYQGRVNEQELFGSFVHQQLLDSKPNVAEKFLKIFEKKFNELKEAGENNKVLRAVRQALAKLVRQDSVLTHSESLDIRRYAIGMAQLDDNKTLLSTKANSDNPSNSPVMKISTALDRIQSNTALTVEEHDEFKKATKAELSGRVDIKYTLDLDGIENTAPDYTLSAL